MTRTAIIVGGGPAGALLAYILASRGVPVSLIERQSDFAREFRGEGLVPGGQQMFREAGLWDAFLALPHTRIEVAELFYKRRHFASVDISMGDGLDPLFVSQPAMLEMLIEKASAFPEFTFRRGVRVAGPLMRDGRVAGVELSNHDGGEILEADFVFGCDGRFSVMRKAAGLDQPQKPEFFDVIWFKVPMPEFYEPGHLAVRGYIGKGHVGLFIPTYDGLLQVGWLIGKGSYTEFREEKFEDRIEEIADHVSDDMAGHLRQNAGNATHPFLLDVICDSYDEWSTPGMLMIGDAAHPMSPVGAQGINIALRDAVVAANHFIPQLLGDADPAALDAAAAAYCEERQKEVRFIQKAQRFMPKFLFNDNFLMDIGIAVLRVFFATGLMNWMIRTFDFSRNPFISGYSKVRLKV